MNILRVILSVIWVLGGGALIACVFIGVPFIIITLLGVEILSFIWENVPQIITITIIVGFLIYGFTTKAEGYNL